MSISILILTLNEESNLPACLESVAWSDDVVVLDSFSSDGTVALAEKLGARVVQRRFDNWSAHQNWALENIEFQHRWVFYLDADERMTEPLRAELEAIAADANERRTAFYCGRENYFMGRWIRHAMPPGLIMRFFQPAHVRFERLVNPTAVVDGESGYLANRFVHYNFSKGFNEWFDKHNKYSWLEALEGMRVLRGEDSRVALTSKDAATRRKALKQLFMKLPGRPVLKFAYLYFGCGGFLDGAPGLTYCALQGFYEYMTVLKMRELALKERGRTL